MGRARPGLGLGLGLALALAVLSLGSGCKMLGDALGGAEAERKGNEASLTAHHAAQEARTKLSPGLGAAGASTPKPTVVLPELNPDTAEARLLALVQARLECRDEACRAGLLKKISADHLFLMQGAPRLLEDFGEPVALAVLRLIGLLEARGSVRAVSRLVGTNASGKREHEAIWALGALKDPRAVPALIRSANGKPTQTLRVELCRALGGIAAPTGVPGIESLLSDSNEAVQIECIVALQRIGTPAAHKICRAYFGKGSAAVQLRARDCVKR